MMGLIKPTQGSVRDLRGVDRRGRAGAGPGRCVHRRPRPAAAPLGSRQPATVLGGDRAPRAPMPTSTPRSRSPGSVTSDRTTRQDLQPRHEAAAGDRAGHARASPNCSCSTSPPTASTRRRSLRCARCCSATPSHRADGGRVESPAGRGRTDLHARRRHAQGPPGRGRFGQLRSRAPGAPNSPSRMPNVQPRYSTAAGISSDRRPGSPRTGRRLSRDGRRRSVNDRTICGNPARSARTTAAAVRPCTTPDSGRRARCGCGSSSSGNCVAGGPRSPGIVLAGAARFSSPSPSNWADHRAARTGDTLRAGRPRDDRGRKLLAVRRVRLGRVPARRHRGAVLR